MDQQARLKSMRFLLLIVLMTAACMPCHNDSIHYCDAPKLPRVALDIDTEDEKTRKSIDDWAQQTMECHGETFDTSLQVTFEPTDAAVTADCGTAAAGCYLPGRIILSVESKWAWPEELAHELGHHFYGVTTDDSDLHHLHGTWFGRPPDEYNWDETTGSVANCVDLHS